MTDQTINPGDWVCLGHEQYPDFRIEGTVRESNGYLKVGKTAIGSVRNGKFAVYTILGHKPGEPDWANDRAVVDKRGTLYARDGVKWRMVLGTGISAFTYTAAEVANFGPITRIDPPRKQS